MSRCSELAMRKGAGATPSKSLLRLGRRISNVIGGVEGFRKAQGQDEGFETRWMLSKYFKISQNVRLNSRIKNSVDSIEICLPTDIY